MVDRCKVARQARLHLVRMQVFGARVVLGRARPLKPALGIEPLVGDAAKNGGQLAHLVPYVARRFEVLNDSEATHEIEKDIDVGA